MTDLAGRPALGLKPAKASRDPAYMARVATLPCVICGARPVEVHHCISGRYGQRRAGDRDTIPLCYWHHRGTGGIHTSKRAWEAMHGPDTGYISATRALLGE